MSKVIDNKRKKLLTIEDLVKFCETNQLNTFNSKESGYQLCVQVPAIFKKAEKEIEDETLLYCILKTCHIGLNRNGSYISEESMKEAMPTLKYKPILCNFTETEDGLDFTSHDMEIDDDGNINYIERQVGCFTADEPYLEYDKEKDKTYVMAYAAIPRDYTETADIIERKNGTKVSVELTINEMSFNSKEKYLQLDSFVFSGCTLLGVDPNTGKEIGEGMEGSRLDIADFSQENNSIINYSEENKIINNKLIETLETLNNTLSKFNINQAEFSADKTFEEGGNETVTKLEELMQKYNKTEADIDFEVKELSDKELELKFAEVFGEESDEDPASDEDGEHKNHDDDDQDDEDDDSDSHEDDPDVDDTGEDDDDDDDSDEDLEDDSDNTITDTNACGGGGSGSGGSKKKKKKKKNELDPHSIKYSVELNGNTRIFEVSLQDKIYAIQDLVNLTYGESDNTYYGVQVYEEYVIMIDYWSGRAYKQSYSEEDDSYTLTGDRVEVYSVWVTKEEEEELNNMKANYTALVQFKADTENAQLHAQRETILYDKKYSVLTEKDENDEYKNKAYGKLVSEMDNYSLTDLEKELKSVFADYITNGGQFDYAGEPEVKSMVNKKLFGVPTSKKTSRYGNLFNK